jgi:hypothetical protein
MNADGSGRTTAVLVGGGRTLACFRDTSLLLRYIGSVERLWLDAENSAAA